MTMLYVIGGVIVRRAPRLPLRRAAQAGELLMTAQRIPPARPLRRRAARAREAARRLHGARLRRASRPGLDRVLGPVERLIYRVCRRRSRRRRWTGRRYARRDAALQRRSACSSSTLLQRAAGRACRSTRRASAAVTPDSSFNTAVSFATNTNWQGYGGETTMSYLTQMLGADGAELRLGGGRAWRSLVALDPRLRARARRETIGNFWVDLTRSTLYILLPLSLVLALVAGLAGRGADLRRRTRRVPRCVAADRRTPTAAAGRPSRSLADGAGRVADRDQAARHQRRRLLQRQLGASRSRTRRRSRTSSRCSRSC